MPASPAGELQDIVVTANRRSENLQTVPITISAFDGAALARSGITNAGDLGAVVPGLVYSSVVGYANPYLRGIGTTATGPGKENPIATYVDGVYLAAQSSALLSLSNIAGIEVDKGPQGTLFGRNATGGAIQIRTLTPSSTTSFLGSAGYGNYDTFEGKLYATTGLAPGLAGDIALAYTDQGKGYAQNLANGKDVDKGSDFVIRSKLNWLLGDATTITLAGDYGRTTGIPTLAPAPGTTPQFDPPVAPKKRDVYGDPQPFLRNSQWGVAATIKHELAATALTSITAYRETHYNSLFDSTLTAEPGTIFFIAGKEPHKQFSQELQLASNTQGPLSWVVGTYYFYEHSGYLEPTTIAGDSFALFGLPSGLLQSPNRRTYSGAAFGQATYAFDPATKLTLGLRYTYEKRTNHFVETLPDFGINDVDARGKTSFKNVSWRIALDHKFTPGVMTYASYNRGFKSGLFNSADAVQPERLDAFEVGLKSTLLDRRLRLNVAGFYYLYKNIQSTSYPDGNLVITNGAKASLYGLDADAEVVVTPELRLTGGLEALHSRYDSFPDAPISVPLAGGGTTYIPGAADGNRLSRTPKLTANIAADYVHLFAAVKFSANVTYSYDDGWFAEADNRLRQPAYSLLNASLTIGTPSDRFAVKLWARNLLNEDYAVALAAQTNGDFIQWAAPPHLWRDRDDEILTGMAPTATAIVARGSNASRRPGVVFASTVGNMLSVTPTVTAVYGVFLVAIATEFGWSRAEVGGALAALSLATALASPFAGRFADRFGVRRSALAGSLALGLAIMALALAPANPLIFYGQFALIGAIGALSNQMIFAKLIAEWFDERRGLWIGIAGGVGNGLGATLLPIFAGVLFGLVGWRDAFLGIGLLILLVGLPVLYFLIQDPLVRRGADDVEAEYEGVGLRTALASPTFWLIATAMPVGAGCLIALFSTLIPILTDRGFSLESATMVLIAFALASTAWEPSTGAILDRTSRPCILAPFYWLAAGGLLLLIGATTLPLLILAGVLLGLGLGAESSALSFLLSRYFGRRALGAISGWAFGLLLGVGALATVLLNLAYDHTGNYRLGIEIMIPLLVWNGAVMFLVGRYRYGGAAVPA